MRATDIISGPAVEPGSAAAIEATSKFDNEALEVSPSLMKRPLLAVARFLDGCIATQPQMTRSGYIVMSPIDRVDKIEANSNNSD